MRWIGFVLLVCLAACERVPYNPNYEPDAQRIDSPNTTNIDSINALTLSATGVYAVGHTFGRGPNGSKPSAGDALVVKYDASGTLVWGEQFGTDLPDFANAVATDEADDVYVVGAKFTGGARTDPFIRKYDADGHVLWTEQYGPSEGGEASGVATTQDAVYVVGRIDTDPEQNNRELPFVRRYSPEGTVVWTRVLEGEFSTETPSVAVDEGGNIVIAGNLDAKAFVRQFSPDGRELWAADPGNATVAQIAVSGDAVYVLTYSYNEQPSHVVKYDTGGTELWAEPLTREQNYIETIVADSSGVIVGGETYGGENLIVKRSPEGRELWTKVIYKSEGNQINALAFGAEGTLYLGGETGLEFAERTDGDSDAYVQLIDEASGETVWTSE